MSDEKTPLLDGTEPTRNQSTASALTELTNPDDAVATDDTSIEVFDQDEDDDVTSVNQAAGQSQSISVSASVSQSARNLWTSQHKFQASSTLPTPSSYAQLADANITQIPEQEPPTDRRSSFRRRRLDSAGSVLTRGSIVSILGEERTGENLITWYQCLAHLLKSMIGCGLLALPFAFSLAGILGGPLLMSLLAVIALVAMNFLVDASRHMCRVEERSYMDYGDLAESVLRHGPLTCMRDHCHIGKLLINILLVFTQLSFCATYFVFLAQTVDSVLTDYGIENPFSDRILICMFLLPIALLSLIRNLAFLALFSLTANILLFFGLGVIIYSVLDDIPNPRGLRAFEPIGDLPLFFGGAIYVVEGIGVVLPLENKMKKPEQFKKVLNFGMSFVFLLCVLFGFLGYNKYRDLIKPSISLNLPNTWYCSAAKIAFAVAMYVTYALQFLVPIRILTPWLFRTFPDANSTLSEYLFRLMLVAITFLAAILIPYLNLFIELIGSFASSSLALILPALICEFSMCSKKNVSLFKKCVFRVLIFIMLVIGFAGGLMGTLLSVKSIIKAFTAEASVNLIKPTTFMPDVTILAD